MPTYEYRCPNGHDFEEFYRSIGSAPTEVACPVCGKIAERQLSGAGLVFKGTGFYITDYGKDGKKGQTPPVKAGEGASAASGADSGAKGDAAGKAETKPTAESKPAPESKAPTSSKSAAKPATKSEKGRE